jgi:glycogen operon protein
VEHPGTYRGAIEKIPYLNALGVTAVELKPVHEFNEQHVIGIDPQTRKPLRKHCSYDPVTFFTPKASYSSSGDLSQQKLEVKEMVMAFRDADIEVILDVVFNHTARRRRARSDAFFSRHRQCHLLHARSGQAQLQGLFGHRQYH